MGNIYSVTTPINGIVTALVSQIKVNALGQTSYQSFVNGYVQNLSYNSDGQTFSAADSQSSSTGGSGATQVPIPVWALVLLAGGLGLLGRRYGRQYGKHLAVLLVLGIGLNAVRAIVFSGGLCALDLAL